MMNKHYFKQLHRGWAERRGSEGIVSGRSDNRMWYQDGMGQGGDGISGGGGGGGVLSALVLGPYKVVK